jgi:hypothetical protein
VVVVGGALESRGPEGFADGALGPERYRWSSSVALSNPAGRRVSRRRIGAGALPVVVVGGALESRGTEG